MLSQFCLYVCPDRPLRWKRSVKIFKNVNINVCSSRSSSSLDPWWVIISTPSSPENEWMSTHEDYTHLIWARGQEAMQGAWVHNKSADLFILMIIASHAYSSSTSTSGAGRDGSLGNRGTMEGGVDLDERRWWACCRMTSEVLRVTRFRGVAPLAFLRLWYYECKFIAAVCSW